MTFLLLRADAAPTLGVGHLSRCVALATAARARGWDAALCGDFTAGQWLIGDLEVLPTPIPADVVLIDHYGLGEVNLPSLVVSMEDGVYGRRRADIVVDANLYDVPRPDDGSPMVLRGPAYAPLRAEIRAARAKRAEGATPPRVVVVMGGGAAPSSVAAAVTALRETAVPADVVAISAAPVPGVEVIPPTPDLPSLLASADLVVSAAGVTLLELCCIGVPAALVRIAENQRAGYEAAVTKGLAAGLGTDPREHVDTLRTLLQDANARKSLSHKAMEAVDGKGAERILDAIESRLHQSPIGAPGGPPISTLPATTDTSPAQKDPTAHLHPPTPNQRTFRAPGGPPASTLPTGTDSSAPEKGVGKEVHPASPSERSFGAPGGPPASTLPADTDSSAPQKTADEEIHPPRPSEGSFAAPGGPPISTLPGSADSSVPEKRVDGEVHPVSPSERSFGAAGGPPDSTLPGGADNFVIVREATVADFGLLLAWRNDPETRAWSRTIDPVAPTDHADWLDRVLADPDRLLLIAERGNHPVGTVRFDREGDHWEVSITVAPDARGQKLAVPMLLAAEGRLGGADIRACVHKDNAASLALFRKAGYARDTTDDPWVWFAKAV
jgi:spore coat polysaccharide biosynthesis predicted glycosyltransferase SpsG/RimJ/RimL family protein N-acetyltransferase